jgi:hypothetical protein
VALGEIDGTITVPADNERGVGYVEEVLVKNQDPPRFRVNVTADFAKELTEDAPT